MLLTATLLAALSVLSGLLAWQSYTDSIETAEARAQSAAQVVAANIQWIGEAAIQALRRIDETLGTRPDTFVGSTAGDLDAAVAFLPRGVQAWVFDSDGDSVLTNEDFSGHISVADREYFRALRGGEEWHVSPLLEGRATGTMVFVIARRIERDGEFLGAATIMIPARLLAEFWASLDLGPDSTVSIVRTDGWLVARYPVPAETIDLSGHELFTTHLPASPAGSYVSPTSPADGISRLVGYYSVTGLPLVAIAGISRNAVMERFWSRVGSAAVVALPIALALLATSVWVAALLRRYERQRLKLGRTLEQNRVLLREVHHRVKNNLQTVASLIQMHPLPQDTKREITRRIAAMGAVHEHIYRYDQFGTLDLAPFVQRLVTNLQQSSSDEVQVEFDLAEVEVEAELAIPLGLVINEVVVNAFKHAFADGSADRRLSISLRPLDERRARIEVRDNGSGFDEAAATAGMGSRLIGGLSRQMGAEHRFRRDGGTVFTLDFPLR